MNKTIAILGAQWGDEGKGKIVDLLTERSDAVVRFQGGHNAGHTLVVDKKTTILHLIPSGILHKDVKCIIGNGVVLSLDALTDEIEVLRKNQVDIEDRLFISDNCPLILPIHIALDQAREVKKAKKRLVLLAVELVQHMRIKFQEEGLDLEIYRMKKSYTKNYLSFWSIITLF